MSSCARRYRGLRPPRCNANRGCTDCWRIRGRALALMEAAKLAESYWPRNVREGKNNWDWGYRAARRDLADALRARAREYP